MPLVGLALVPRQTSRGVYSTVKGLPASLWPCHNK